MLLYMSLTGTILIAGVLLMRPAESRFLPPRFFVLLWDVVLARLLLPIAFPAPFGLSVATGISAHITAAAGKGSISPWLIVWAAGAAASAIRLTWLFAREHRLLQDALLLTKNGLERLHALGIRTRHVQIQTSDRIATPVAGGVFRPRIILPASWTDWDDSTIRFVVTHELSHVRARDTVQKLIMAAALCVHWFNPVVWIMQNAMDRDLEKACDENVLRTLGEDERCAYAETLITLAAGRPRRRAVFASGFGRSAVHDRVVSMMRAQKTGTAAVAAGILILTCCSTAFAVAVPTPDAAQSPSADVHEAVYLYNTDTGELFRGAERIGVLSAPSVSISMTGSFAIPGS